MESFLTWAEAIGFVIMIIGVLLLVYRTFSDPDHKAKSRLDVIESSCGLKHSALDETIAGINTNIANIKGNHLFHIENDISDIKVSLASIETALSIQNRKK